MGKVKRRNMNEKYTELLKSQISKLENQDFDLDAWKGSTTILLERIFGELYSGIKPITLIKNHVSDLRALGGSYMNNIKQCKQQGKEILEACITELEIFGLPEKKKSIDSGLKINMIQNQTVNISIIMSALKDELTSSQMEEIKEIVEGSEPKSTKLRKVIDKIESFGKDIASNILANILINPSTWG